MSSVAPDDVIVMSSRWNRDMVWTENWERSVYTLKTAAMKNNRSGDGKPETREQTVKRWREHFNWEGFHEWHHRCHAWIKNVLFHRHKPARLSSIQISWHGHNKAPRRLPGSTDPLTTSSETNTQTLITILISQQKYRSGKLNVLLFTKVKSSLEKTGGTVDWSPAAVKSAGSYWRQGQSMELWLSDGAVWSGCRH